jgi:hypothetical protein
VLSAPQDAPWRAPHVHACGDARSRCAALQTHKTGSTTLGAALFRFGARYHKARYTPQAGAARAPHCACTELSRLRSPLQRFYCQGTPPQACKKAHILWPGKPLPPRQVYDLQLNHLSGNGVLRGTFGSVVAWYKARTHCVTACAPCQWLRGCALTPCAQTMLGTDGGVWRRSGGVAAPPWALVVPMRNPVSHYLSWFFYFGEPDNRMSVEQWAATGMGANGLAAEFGLKTQEDVERFIESMAWGCAACTPACARKHARWFVRALLMRCCACEQARRGSGGDGRRAAAVAACGAFR